MCLLRGTDWIFKHTLILICNYVLRYWGKQGSGGTAAGILNLDSTEKSKQHQAPAALCRGTTRYIFDAVFLGSKHSLNGLGGKETL